MTTDHDSATDIAKSLDVQQAISIIKCFTAGISSTFSEAATISSVTGEQDPFADLDVSVNEDLENRVQQVAPGSGISTYLESDNELLTCYSLLTEQQLLEAIDTSHNVMEMSGESECSKTFSSRAF